MDINQTNKQNFQSLKEFSKLRFPRKKAIIILLFSLSLFSILCSFSSYFSIEHYKFCLKVFLSYYSTDKKYIFLLCNGILAFLITKSGMMGNRPSIISPFVGIIDSTENRIREFRRTEVFEFPTAKIVTEKVVMEVEEKDVEEEKKENGASVMVCKDDEDQEILQKFENSDDEEDQENQEEDQENQEEEEEEEEEEYDDDGDDEKEEGGIKFLISLVELNGKCDNFIKMMREGIKI